MVLPIPSQAVSGKQAGYGFARDVPQGEYYMMTKAWQLLGNMAVAKWTLPGFSAMATLDLLPAGFRPRSVGRRLDRSGGHL